MVHGLHEVLQVVLHELHHHEHRVQLLADDDLGHVDDVGVREREQDVDLTDAGQWEAVLLPVHLYLLQRADAACRDLPRPAMINISLLWPGLHWKQLGNPLTDPMSISLLLMSMASDRVSQAGQQQIRSIQMYSTLFMTVSVITIGMASNTIWGADSPVDVTVCALADLVQPLILIHAAASGEHVDLPPW